MAATLAISPRVRGNPWHNSRERGEEARENKLKTEILKIEQSAPSVDNICTTLPAEGASEGCQDTHPSQSENREPSFPLLESTPPELLGSCVYRGKTVAILEGSQELQDLLGAVTAKGLETDSGHHGLRGTLLEQVKARQDYLIGILPDTELLALCKERRFYRANAAREQFARRIFNRERHCFASLMSIAATHPCRDELLRLAEAALEPAVRAVSACSADEVKSLCDSPDQLLAYAAKKRRKRDKRRQFMAGQQTRMLKKVPVLSLQEVIAAHNQYRRKGLPELQESLACRLKNETVGWDEVISMLPTRSCNKAEYFLRCLGLAPVGYATLPGEPHRDRWDKAAVLKTLTHHPACLYKRARDEYRGQLPDDLHARMLFDTGPYVKKYVEFLQKVAAKRGCQKRVSKRKKQAGCIPPSQKDATA